MVHIADEIKKKSLRDIEADLNNLLDDQKRYLGDFSIVVGCTIDHENRQIIDQPKTMNLAELQQEVYFAAKEFGSEHDYFYQMFDCLKNAIAKYIIELKSKHDLTKTELVSLINQLQMVIQSLKKNT